MVNPERERSSSSPSVEIEQVVRRKGGRPGEEIKVVLADASSFFVAMRVWEEAPFYDGDEVDERRWESILARSRLVQTRARAMSLLARSEHSRFLLRRKLVQRELDATDVDRVLDELEESGSLSDERFAIGWVRTRLRSHPEGRAHLVGGLRNRGIDAALAERAINTVLDEHSTTMADSARACAQRLTRRRNLSVDELRDRLHRRGFVTPIARRIAEEIGEAGDDAGDGYDRHE